MPGFDALLERRQCVSHRHGMGQQVFAAVEFQIVYHIDQQKRHLGFVRGLVKFVEISGTVSLTHTALRNATAIGILIHVRSFHEVRPLVLIQESLFPAIRCLEQP